MALLGGGAAAAGASLMAAILGMLLCGRPGLGRARGADCALRFTWELVSRVEGRATRPGVVLRVGVVASARFLELKVDLLQVVVKES